MRLIPLVHADIERHPAQDDWGRAEFTVLLTADTEALVGEPFTSEFNEAFTKVAEAIEQATLYNLTPYSGGPGRPFKSEPSIRLDEWDGQPAVVITSRFGMDV